MTKIKTLVPGVMVCAAIAFLGTILGQYFSNIGAATFAILLGILVGNTIAKNNLFATGSKFSESNLLTYSIVLLGGTLSFQSVLQVGWQGMLFIVTQMILTIAFCIYFGQKLGFGRDFSYLMASGNAVCGSSAIASTAPVLKATETDKLISITIVNLIGSILMINLPIIAGSLFDFDALRTSAFIGGILQSIGQVVASGSMVNESVKDLSTIFKIVRIIFLVAVVFCLGSMKNAATKEAVAADVRVGWRQIPWYVVGFFLMCVLFSLQIIPDNLSQLFKQTSGVFEIIALAGIGMRINIGELMHHGLKVSMYGVAIACVQIVTAISLIKLIYN
ncbi:YeiH family protein [Succinispira mobilis]|uniref:YeiH family protein n=1 Tax=Succinispira mobilis TaxID=78120 RepID=UPI000364F564|nr:putative sulfate exporter family transporter [Succinispira mobilis]